MSTLCQNIIRGHETVCHVMRGAKTVTTQGKTDYLWTNSPLCGIRPVP